MPINDWTFRADIRNLSNYYPYGMQLPGGAYASIGNYGYGYNGMEKDDELRESLYSTLFREGDTKNGRWWSRDPMEMALVGYSSYIMMGGNPINFIDPLGDVHQPYKGEEIVVTSEKSDTKTNADGTGITFIEDQSWLNGGDYEYVGNMGEFYVLARKNEDGQIIEYNLGLDGDAPVFSVGKDGLRQIALNLEYYYDQIALLNLITDNKVLQGKFFNDPLNPNNIWDTEGYDLHDDVIQDPMNWYMGISGFLGGMNYAFARTATRFSLESVDDFVLNLRKIEGGNVSVFKDGVLKFRVHKPGDHKLTHASITKFKQGRINPKTGKPHNIKSKAVTMDEDSFEILKKAVNKQDGYSIGTKGGR